MSPVEPERAALYDAAAQLTDYVSVTAGTETFLVPTTPHGLGRGLYVRRSRSDMTQLGRAVCLLAEEGVDIAGSVLLDVGANIGTTTVTALRRHGFGSAVSIEPVERNARTLRMNLVLNDLEGRVQVIMAAVASREQQGALRVKRSIGAAKLAPAGTPNLVPVPVVSLDSLAASGVVDLERVGLAWIDTAGHEAEVIAGASKLIAARVPLVVRFRRRNIHEQIRRQAMDALAASYTTAIDLKRLRRLTPAEFDRLERERPRSHRVLFRA